MSRRIFDAKFGFIGIADDTYFFVSLNRIKKLISFLTAFIFLRQLPNPFASACPKVPILISSVYGIYGIVAKNPVQQPLLPWDRTQFPRFSVPVV
jgi:hypothetical protein